MMILKKGIYLMLALTLLLSAGACSAQKKSESKDTDITAEEVLDTAGAETKLPNAEDDPYIWADGTELTVIETPYTTLKRPEAWNDILDVKGTEEDGAYVLRFIGKNEFEGVCIFSVRFGESDDISTLLGFLGETPIYVYVNDDTEGYEGETLERFYELQGYVNDVIVQLQYDEGFVR